MAETVLDISLLIHDLEMDPCKRANQIGAPCDGDCVACHSRVLEIIIDRLRAAYGNDIATSGRDDMDGRALDEVIEWMRDCWKYDQCERLAALCGREASDGCSGGTDCRGCHQSICDIMSHRVLQAWMGAFDADYARQLKAEEDGSYYEGLIAEEKARVGTVIDGRPDSREGLGFVVAWERDVDGLTVRDPRDVASVRFDALGAFPTYEAARAFIKLITEEYGSGKGWVESLGRP